MQAWGAGLVVIASAVCALPPMAIAQSQPGGPDLVPVQNIDQWRPRYPSTPLPNIGKGIFQVTVAGGGERLQKFRLESVVIMIKRSDGTPVLDASVKVFGRARDVVRLMSTRPRVTKNLGAGRYQLSGLRFSMDGSWLLVFDISSGDEKDKALVELEIK